ncbi:uncharacterized protein B0J16DRAFT_291207, partial [Fusarium flagelliforme]|uniref:uncharacterized protein n=1 Tax=Fusarium flagelliforme TaxID=2675880 RepID=UPI001E8D512A
KIVGVSSLPLSHSLTLRQAPLDRWLVLLTSIPATPHHTQSFQSFLWIKTSQFFFFLFSESLYRSITIHSFVPTG